ncbi:RNA polymerase factor sigma-54 [Inquilinus sp. CAU 1745]|uniref:RNA polymerase factor sigma-54 n=1 Tax=Inquilinus sp. CAU 1745 TaxID=3140369 RepID=UPI00325BCFDE
MALTQRLDLRQSQTLVMTPQLQQAIKLLQLSNLELSDYVDQELERNPLLERDDGDSHDPDPRETYEDAPETELSTDRVGADRLTGSDTMAGSDGPLDTDYENVWTSAGTADAAAEAGPDAGVPWTGKGGGFDDGDYDFQQTLSERPNLRDHLLAQAREELPAPADRLIAAHLIDLIDETGYLRAELDAVAEQLGCSFGKVETVLAALQKLDPPGVAARSLPECLALQLAEKNRLDPAMAALLDNLDMLAARDYAALIRLCGVDREDLADMIAEIRALDPKPGQAFDGEVAQIVTPDILMRPKADGGWVVELNADNLPRVLINQRYYSEIAAGARTKADKDYLTDCFASANWLVKSLHQRATTILKVATEIVSQQGLFFARGVQYLKPLILRDIADAIGMHESTVSRVTTNKFIATPRGLFELKYFFTSSIQGANGADAHSAEAVRFRIKSLIDAETAGTVLSDDRIVELLHGDGIDIARRTVAKYREGMKIPSSVQRRREKGIRL